MDEYRVSPARAEDAESIVDVFLNARREMSYLPQDLHTDTETRAWIKSLLEDPSNVVLVVRASADMIAGFCVIHGTELEHLYVHPEFQNRGIGTLLLKAAQETKPHLELWVFQKNLGAISFYKRNGFRLAKETDGSRNEEKEPDARYVWSYGQDLTT